MRWENGACGMDKGREGEREREWRSLAEYKGKVKGEEREWVTVKCLEGRF